MKIQTLNYENIHCHAGCYTCDFTAGIQTEKTPTSQDVNRAAKQHVRETGHTVWVETGSHREYAPGRADAAGEE